MVTDGEALDIIRSFFFVRMTLTERLPEFWSISSMLVGRIFRYSSDDFWNRDR
jgi:hypothetical protein